MTAIAQELDDRLKKWEPGTVDTVTKLIAEIITLADQNALDLIRSRVVEQEVLDLLDEPKTR